MMGVVDAMILVLTLAVLDTTGTLAADNFAITDAVLDISGVVDANTRMILVLNTTGVLDAIILG